MLKPRGLYSRNSSSQGDSLCHAKHGLSWARAIVLWTTIATTSMHTVDGRSAQTGRPSPRYCLHGRQDARVRRDERPCKRWVWLMVWLWRNSYPTPSTRKMSSTVSHIHMEHPPNARTDPQCDSHLHSVVHSGRTPSTCSCTLSTTLYAQRTTAPHARRGSAHFLEKREPLALGS